jgi:hypothetical protein
MGHRARYYLTPFADSTHQPLGRGEFVWWLGHSGPILSACRSASILSAGFLWERRGRQRPAAGTGTPLPKQESHVAADRRPADAQLSRQGRLRAPRGQPALDEKEPGDFPPANQRPETTHAVVMPAAGGPAADFLPRSGGRPEAAVVARFCSHGCLHASVAGWIVKALTVVAGWATPPFLAPGISLLDCPRSAGHLLRLHGRLRPGILCFSVTGLSLVCPPPLSPRDSPPDR